MRVDPVPPPVLRVRGAVAPLRVCLDRRAVMGEQGEDHDDGKADRNAEEHFEDEHLHGAILTFLTGRCTRRTSVLSGRAKR